jgi:hypothetical protein
MRLLPGGGRFPCYLLTRHEGPVIRLPRHHVTAFLDPGRSQFVEQLRRTWDPGMAEQIAAHVTLVYPEEIPDAAELAAKAALAAARTPAFYHCHRIPGPRGLHGRRGSPAGR